MNDLKQSIKKLLSELYVKTYKEESNIFCCIDSNVFKMYLANDWRFKNIYYDYRITKNSNISITDFINQELYKLPKFIFDHVLDIPKKEQPEHIYVDVKYPFKFESFNTNAPTFDDFCVKIHSRFLNKLGSYMFNKLKEDEIRTRFIEELKYKIKLRNNEYEQRKKELKPQKRIYKYDADGNIDKIYDNRISCCNGEGITPAALSMHLSGKRKKLKGYVYKEIRS